MTSIFQALADIEKQGKAGVFCEIVRCSGSTPRGVGSKMLVYPDGSIAGTVGGGEVENRVIQEALASLDDGKPRLLSYSMAEPGRGDPGVCGGQLEVFVEPILPTPMVLVIGAGHVGKEVAALAHWLGFRVAVSDDRGEFCTPEAVPDADEYYPGPMVELPGKLEINPRTNIVLTTRGVDVDVLGLPALLETPAKYFGVIGSRRRWETAKALMLESGVPTEKLALVHSPIGLEIEAETPREIAVSIMAEIIMVNSGGDGQPMSKPIDKFIKG
jgi:xanthine dehydrogenase accessory factor